MNREDSLKYLKYGSFEKIQEAFNNGCGIFFRDDVEILLSIINTPKPSATSGDKK